MKRTLMHVYAKGSVEAVALYQRAFGATLGYHVISPDNTYDHAELDIFGQIVSVAEKADVGPEAIPGNTMQFCLHFEEGEESAVKQAYEVLKVNGKVLFPLGPSDYSPYAADLIDAFGVRWGLFV